MMPQPIRTGSAAVTGSTSKPTTKQKPDKTHFIGTHPFRTHVRLNQLADRTATLPAVSLAELAESVQKRVNMPDQWARCAANKNSLTMASTAVLAGPSPWRPATTLMWLTFAAG
jgi:hypothetical protein